MKGTILITHKFRELKHEDALKELEGYDIVYFITDPQIGILSKEKTDRLFELIKTIDPVALMLNYPIYPLLRDNFWNEVYEKTMKLKLILTLSTGFDFIDAEAAKKNGVYVTNCKGKVSEATAEMAMWLVMSCLRKAHQWNKIISDDVGSWKSRSNYAHLGNCISGKTLGIIGMGSIGQELARMSRFGFRMKVLYFKRTQLSEEEENKLEVEYCSEMSDLLRRSDVVSLNCPLNKSTFHLIKEDEIRKMKKTAYLVNTSRGKVIKEEDLVKCLEEKVIAGVGLDVFDPEPCNQQQWNKFVDLGCCVVPHIGGYVEEIFGEMEMMCLENMKTVLIRNEKPQGNVY